jgi:hypothetical protein
MILSLPVKDCDFCGDIVGDVKNCKLNFGNGIGS